MTAFVRYVGIDYSGAETPNASLKGLRVYLANGESTADEVQPPPSPRKYWTRRGLAEWFAALLPSARRSLFPQLSIVAIRCPRMRWSGCVTCTTNWAARARG